MKINQVHHLINLKGETLKLDLSLMKTTATYPTPYILQIGIQGPHTLGKLANEATIVELLNQIQDFLNQSLNLETIQPVYLPAATDLTETEGCFFDAYYPLNDQLAGDEAYQTEDGEIGKCLLALEKISPISCQLEFLSPFIKTEAAGLTELLSLTDSPFKEDLMECFMGLLQD